MAPTFEITDALIVKIHQLKLDTPDTDTYLTNILELGTERLIKKKQIREAFKY